VALYVRGSSSVEHVIGVVRRALAGERVAQPGTAACLDPETKLTTRHPVSSGHFFVESRGVLADLEHRSLTRSLTTTRRVRFYCLRFGGASQGTENSQPPTDNRYFS